MGRYLVFPALTKSPFSGSTIFGSRENLPVPNLTSPNDWSRLQRAPASFPTPPAWSGAPTTLPSSVPSTTAGPPTSTATTGLSTSQQNTPSATPVPAPINDREKMGETVKEERMERRTSSEKRNGEEER